MEAEPKSRKNNCLEGIRQRILTQDLEPGSYLDETEISTAYEISRPPLREILRQLAGEGYVILHENRGAQVAPMTHKTMRSFFIVAPMIYAAVSRLAALHANRTQIAALKEIQRRFRGAIASGEVADRALLNERFHAMTGEMAGNEYLIPSLRRLLIDHTRIGMTFYDPHNAAMSEQRSIAADQHDEFIAHIESRNADAAAELAVEHWELARKEMERFVTPESISIPLGRGPEILESTTP